jgi:hypothetical protein
MYAVHNRFLPQVPINQPDTHLQRYTVQFANKYATQLFCLLIVRIVERLDQGHLHPKLEVP